MICIIGNFNPAIGTWLKIGQVFIDEVTSVCNLAWVLVLINII